MGAACCRCVQPASLQPRKTYNTLVSQLFSGVPIKTDEPIDSTMRRKIQKLQEYLQANPAKVPKASRRLMRRIRATLRKPGDNLGHVKVAVHTYAYLLAKSADESSSYGPTFFLKELLTGPDAVVPLLLKDIHIEMRTLGAELLAVFTQVQSPVDSKLDPIQAHVPQVCRVAQAALRSDRKEQKLQETTERRRAGDKLAVPDPIYLIGRRDPAHVAALEVSCLHCLKEVVVLCRRNKVVPAQIQDIQAVMLENLHASRGAAGAFTTRDGSAASLDQPASAAAVPQPTEAATAAAAAADAAAVPVGVVDAVFYQSMGMQHFLPQGTHPRVEAEQLLLRMASFTQDISMVDKILDSFYEYMDDRGRWQEAGIIKHFLAALGSGGGAEGGQHPYPIFASLLRHSCSRKLSVEDCTAVLRVAKDLGVRLDEAYSLSALQLALDELPHAWAQQARRDPKGLFIKPFLDLWRAGTAAMKDLAHIGESPTPGQVPSQAAAHALRSTSQSGTPVGGEPISSSQSTAGAGPPGESAAAVRKQLAELKITMLQTVQALGARVQTTAELCEVLTGVLDAIAASLHYSSSPVLLSGDGAAGAAYGAAAGGPADAAGGPSPFFAAVSAGGAGGVRDTAAVPDPDKLAAAGMALQLAAAAAEGCLDEQQTQFVTPANSFTGVSGSSTSSMDGGAAARSLPGGVLPARLVAAALPLLTQGPCALSHALQRLLLALVPSAPQGVAAPQASQLAQAALLELHHSHSSSSAAAAAAAAAAEDPVEPNEAAALAAGVDALLRCCLRGQQAPPGVVLTVSRALLLQQEQWLQHGFSSSAGVSPDRAHAVLLLHNSQLAALAGATKASSLLSQQLPLDASSHPMLRLTVRGLVVVDSEAGLAAAAATSAAALQALQQQQPHTRQHVDSLRATLLKVSVLVDAYGSRLPELLDTHQSLRLSVTEGAAVRQDKAQLTSSRAGVQLPERQATLSKGKLMHVGDLLQRNSMTRSRDLPSIAAVLESSKSTPGAEAAPTAAVGPAASRVAPVAEVAEAAAEADVGAAANLPARAPVSSAAAAGGGLPSVSIIQAGGTKQPAASATAAAAAAAAAVSTRDVQLELPAQGSAVQGAGQSLSATVAAVLQRPGPAGAFVMRDIKIGKLAGELDSQL